MKNLIIAGSLIICLIWNTPVASGQKNKATTAPVQTDAGKQRLELEIARLSAISGGTVGVSVIHVESGKRIVQNGQDHFPLASTFKVPVEIALLMKVDSGKYSLDQLVELEDSDLSPGGGMIAARFRWPNSEKPGLALSVRSLLELNLLISDNTAADVCMRLAGGPSAVTANLKRLGIEGLRVDRPTKMTITDYLGLGIAPTDKWSPARFDTLAKKITPEMEKVSGKIFNDDIRDTSTPEAMSELLLKLFTQQILKPESKSLILDIMRRCETGPARLKGLLPPDTEVRHKTGTIGMTTNDVGIMTLPGDAGHVVISVFVKSSEKEVEDRERAIAEIARTVYDYFVINR